MLIKRHFSYIKGNEAEDENAPLPRGNHCFLSCYFIHLYLWDQHTKVVGNRCSVLQRKISTETKNLLARQFLLPAGWIPCQTTSCYESTANKGKADIFILYTFGFVLTAASDLHWLKLDLTI